MNERNSPESRFDAAAGRLLDGFAQRISRRGILARVGKVALGLMGVTLAPSLPLNRIFQVEAQSSCLAQSLCGIYGRLCNTGSSTCCHGGTGPSGCPSCTTKGPYAWSKCCAIGCAGSYVEYWDCCGGTEAEAAGCTGAFCERNTPQPEWCSGGTYRCTLVIVTSVECTP